MRSLALALSGALLLAGADPAPAQPDRRPESAAESRALALRLGELIAAGQFAEALPVTERFVALSRSRLGPTHPETLTSLDILAGLYARLSQIDRAIATHQEALRGWNGSVGSDHPRTLHATENLADSYVMAGRWRDAESLYAGALATLERVSGPADRQTLTVAIKLGRTYSTLGRGTEALPLFERAYHGLRSSTEIELLTSAAAILGSAYREAGRTAEARAVLSETARTLARAVGPSAPASLRIRFELARLDTGAGGERALATLLAEARRAPAASATARATAAELAGRLIERNRYRDAEPLLAEIADSNRAVLGQDHPDTTLSLLRLVYARLQIGGMAPQALEVARTATASVRRRRAASTDLATFARDMRVIQDQFRGYWLFGHTDALWAASGAAPTSDPVLVGEAFSVLQEMTAGAAELALSQQAAERIAGARSPALERTVRERAQLLETLAGIERRVSEANSAEASAQAAQVLPSLQSEAAALNARLLAIDTAIRRDFPEYFTLLRAEPVALDAARALLAPDEAILLIVPSEFGTHSIAVTRDRIQWSRAEIRQPQVEQAVSTLLRDIRSTMAGQGYRYDRQTAFTLYQGLIAPLAPLLAGRRHVFVVGGGPLTSLPLGVLVTEAPQGRDDDPSALRATRWFADAHALIQLPTVQSLQLLRRSPPRQANRQRDAFLGFGDPVLNGQAPGSSRARAGAGASALFAAARDGGSGLADIAAIRQLTRLPGTATELQNMRAALGAPAGALYLAERATERNFRSLDLSRAQIVALATHGLVAGNLSAPAEPGLVFTPPATATAEDDGYLTASEIAALRLNADWVILSACDTAAGDGRPGAPGLSGLARAFFHAGARNLLASHWPVADEVAPRLTVRTIELLRGGSLSRAEALQRAMREVREDMTNPAWAHPGAWAPFALIGDGAR